jgi:ATP-dependent Clp protease ATP-binding subunit ClpC
MEEAIHQRLIGQNEAVTVISQAVRRARAGLKDARRPIGSFMFLGPTGVGKTELARSLAAFLFDNEDAIIRLDMSEFMERHSTARLVGSPPGYVGYDEGGQLTEAVRRRPYSVVLFDEIEKAHPEVFNMLLQILEDGRLSDAKGKAVNFANTIVIMTSNLGVANLKGNNMSLGFQPSIPDEKVGSADHARMRDTIMEELKRAFRPEFLNRVDAVVVFQRLNHEQMRKIVELMLARIATHLAAQELLLNVSDEAKDQLVTQGFDKVYGARPLRRVIQKVIEDPLAEELLRLKHGPGDTVVVEVVEGEVKMHLVSKPGRREKGERKEKAEAAAAAPSE